MRQKIYIESMGCVRRALDSDKFAHYFTVNGLAVTKKAQKADYILFITCAFRKIEEDYAIKRIRELSKYKARLIVGGCLQGVNEKRLYQNFTGFTFTTSDNKQIDNLFPDFKIKFSQVLDSNFLYPKSKLRLLLQYFFAIRLDFSYLKRLKILWERKYSGHYHYLRISWGCEDQHCTYCSIWRAIGKLKSKPIEVCLREFKKLLEDGYKKIILVADNLGIYGLDINLTLPDLLSRFLETDGDYDIHLEELHPFWLITYLDKLIPLFLRGKIKSIICPIQSGNDRILQLMNRRHNRLQLKDALLKIKEIYPKLKLYTTIIVGFPSESELEFEETLDFTQEIGFELVYIFGYSKNPHITNTAIIQQEIPEDIIKIRVDKAIKFYKKHKIACAIA